MNRHRFPAVTNTSTARPSRTRSAWAAAAGAALFVVAGCAGQAPYEPVSQATPAAWTLGTMDNGADASKVEEPWWTVLHDPAIDTLVAAAMGSSPTLAQAVARLDEAQATVRSAGAARGPSVSGSADAGRSRTAATPSSPATISNNASIGLSLSWELDLWGRLRESGNAASRRLDARTFDAESARLSLAAQVADGVLDLRACHYSLDTRAHDIASREKQLAQTRRRTSVGYAAPVEEARSLSSLASAQTDFISQRQLCAQTTNSLVALTGESATTVQRLVSRTAAPRSVGSAEAPVDPIVGSDPDDVIPSPPPVALRLPAEILAAHPSVASAERNVAAAWADIAVARADRLPRIDLGAALGGQWLQVAGSTLRSATWSLGPALSVPVFDGGSGSAAVQGYEARYRGAVGTLQSTVRTTVQNVEDALAAQQSAQERSLSSRTAADAALKALTASEAQWRAGSISLFELEDARRSFARAQESAITAARDRAQSWVGLVKATGNSINRNL